MVRPYRDDEEGSGERPESPLASKPAQNCYSSIPVYWHSPNHTRYNFIHNEAVSIKFSPIRVSCDISSPVFPSSSKTAETSDEEDEANDDEFVNEGALLAPGVYDFKMFPSTPETNTSEDIAITDTDEEPGTFSSDKAISHNQGSTASISHPDNLQNTSVQRLKTDDSADKDVTENHTDIPIIYISDDDSEEVSPEGAVSLGKTQISPSSNKRYEIHEAKTNHTISLKRKRSETRYGSKKRRSSCDYRSDRQQNASYNTLNLNVYEILSSISLRLPRYEITLNKSMEELGVRLPNYRP